jgi:hypothetical protein
LTSAICARKPVRLHHGVKREVLLQVLHQGFCPLRLSTAGQHQCAELLSFGTVRRYVHPGGGSLPCIRLTENLFTESSFQFPE